MCSQRSGSHLSVEVRTRDQMLPLHVLHVAGDLPGVPGLFEDVAKVSQMSEVLAAEAAAEATDDEMPSLVDSSDDEDDQTSKAYGLRRVTIGGETAALSSDDDKDDEPNGRAFARGRRWGGYSVYTLARNAHSTTALHRAMLGAHHHTHSRIRAHSRATPPQALNSACTLCSRG